MFIFSHYSEDRHPVNSFNIPVEFREVWWEEGPSKTPIFQREDLLQGHEIEGPAIIEQMDSTTPIAPKEHAVVETYGSLIISLD